jgi:hypothetical protein
MAALEKVINKKSNLESCFDNLIEHVHGMTREDFEPHTDPGAIVESAEETCQGRIAEIDLKILEQEELTKKAEHVLSLQLQLQAVLPGAPQQGAASSSSSSSSSSLPVFRAH